MNVGDYVRALTFGGKVKIARIEEIEDGYIYLDNKFVVHDIIKSSPNIINLIEVGDYVNGEKVTNLTNVDKVICDVWSISGDNIKTIVTKEEFERIQYKVGE